MKLKLDENLGKSTATVFRNAGHDAATIADEGLSSVELKQEKRGGQHNRGNEERNGE